jgi:hypothetical protein
MPSPRRFPAPWSVEELSACFVVSDSAGQKLAYIYFEDEPGRRTAARLLTTALKLLGDGVRLSEIIRAVSQIRQWLPDVGLANVRFHAGPHYSLEIEQPGGRGHP